MTKKPLGVTWVKKVRKTTKPGVFLHKASPRHKTREVEIILKKRRVA